MILQVVTQTSVRGALRDFDLSAKGLYQTPELILEVGRTIEHIAENVESGGILVFF